MFSSISIYVVPKEHVEQFLKVQKEMLAIYQDEGCLDEATYAPVDLRAKYGCTTFADTVDAGPDDEVFISVSRFHNQAHHDEVMDKVDADPRLSQLYTVVTKILDTGRVVRGEFERVV